MAANENNTVTETSPANNNLPTKQEKADDSTITSREDAQPNRPEYPTGLRLVLIIIALSLAVFLVALDQTIIATAIPRITDRFNSVNDIGWYGSVSLLID
jgi:hypothetical protein